MKKLLKISVIFIILLLGIVTKVYGANCKVSLKIDKDNLEKKEEFLVEVDLAEIQDEKGIIGLSGILEYDTKSIEIISMSGINWSSPFYNDANGMFIIDRGGFATSSEAVFQIKCKILDTARNKVSITLRNLVASDGENAVDLEKVVGNITVKGGDKSEATSDDMNTSSSTGANVNIATTSLESNLSAENNGLDDSNENSNLDNNLSAENGELNNSNADEESSNLSDDSSDESDNSNDSNSDDNNSETESKNSGTKKDNNELSDKLPIIVAVCVTGIAIIIIIIIRYHSLKRKNAKMMMKRKGKGRRSR